VNPLLVLPFLAYTIVAVLLPGQVDGRRRSGPTLIVTELIVAGFAVAAGVLLGKLAVPSGAGLVWGRWLLLATVYLYVCGRGVVLVRGVLDLPALHMRRDDDRSLGAVEIARGRTIGVLERALALTLVYHGEFSALGLVIAAKSLARFKALEDREFAEYFLIGTLASLLLAVVGGVVLRTLLG
jgi:hypothetical protein